MNDPTAAVLVIGDEILSGKTDDQNSRFLIRELRGLGVHLRRILTIPDEIGEVAAGVRDLAPRFDHVFTSGGVGPTHDDVTIKGVAEALGRPVVRHAELAEKIRAYLREEAGESHLRMADVPEGADLLTSPGLEWPVIACGNVYILPGVPELFQRKFKAIQERFRVSPFFARAVFTQQDEFDVAVPLRHLAEEHPHVKIGSYPNLFSSEYRVKLTLESKDPTAVQAALDSLMSVLDREQLVRSE